MANNMKKTLNNDNYIIIGRNKRNTFFYIKPLNNFIKELNENMIIKSTNDQFVPEILIIEMINLKLIELYLYFNNDFIKIIVENYRLKLNKDNIETIPILNN
jgi:hypothetical protein